MLIKTVELKGRVFHSSRTEMLFEIASAKSEGVEIVRFDIPVATDETEQSNLKKMTSSLIKELRQMKTKGQIQLYATPTSFEKMSTEAVFLLNKYPFLSDDAELTEKLEGFIYVKI